MTRRRRRLACGKHSSW